MEYRVESHAASSTASRADFSNPSKTRRISRSAGSRDRKGERRGKISYPLPFLAVFWADEERVGDDGMAVVNGKMGSEGEVGGGSIFSSALPVDRPYKPSISPTSSKRSQAMKSAVLPGTQLLLIHFKFFRNGYRRLEPCPISLASFEPNILQMCFTAHTQEWQIWPDN
jgi:hypothetical protein